MSIDFSQKGIDKSQNWYAGEVYLRLQSTCVIREIKYIVNYKIIHKIQSPKIYITNSVWEKEDMHSIQNQSFSICPLIGISTQFL